MIPSGYKVQAPPKDGCFNCEFVIVRHELFYCNLFHDAPDAGPCFLEWSRDSRVNEWGICNAWTRDD